MAEPILTFRPKNLLDFFSYLAAVGAGIGFLVGAAGRGWIPVGLVVLVGAGLSVASWLRTSLTVTAEGIVVQRLLRRLSFNWSDIAQIETDELWGPWNRYPTSIPVVVLRSGKRKRIWMLDGVGFHNKRVHDLAKVVNEHIYRAPGGLRTNLPTSD
jgi:hypothetical protein